MSSLFRNRFFLGLIILFVAGMFVYNSFLKSASAPASAQVALSAGADLVKLSQELSNATLGQTLFSKPSYKMLIDFSLPIPTQTTGRANPFQIIGRD